MSELSKLQLDRAIRRHLREKGSILDVLTEDVLEEIREKDKDNQDPDTLLSEMLSCQLNKKNEVAREQAEEFFKAK